MSKHHLDELVDYLLLLDNIALINTALTVYGECRMAFSDDDSLELQMCDKIKQFYQCCGWEADPINMGEYLELWIRQ